MAMTNATLTVVGILPDGNTHSIHWAVTDEPARLALDRIWVDVHPALGKVPEYTATWSQAHGGGPVNLQQTWQDQGYGAGSIAEVVLEEVTA